MCCPEDVGWRRTVPGRESQSMLLTHLFHVRYTARWFSQISSGFGCIWIFCHKRHICCGNDVEFRNRSLHKTASRIPLRLVQLNDWCCCTWRPSSARRVDTFQKSVTDLIIMRGSIDVKNDDGYIIPRSSHFGRSDTGCLAPVDQTTLCKAIQHPAQKQIIFRGGVTCNGATQDCERLYDLVYMIIVRVTEVACGSVEVGWREGSLRVRCASWRQECAILRTKAIKPHTRCERLVSLCFVKHWSKSGSVGCDIHLLFGSQCWAENHWMGGICSSSLYYCTTSWGTPRGTNRPNGHRRIPPMRGGALWAAFWVQGVRHRRSSGHRYRLSLHNSLYRRMNRRVKQPLFVDIVRVDAIYYVHLTHLEHNGWSRRNSRQSERWGNASCSVTQGQNRVKGKEGQEELRTHFIKPSFIRWWPRQNTSVTSYIKEPDV